MRNNKRCSNCSSHPSRFGNVGKKKGVLPHFSFGASSDGFFRTPLLRGSWFFSGLPPQRARSDPRHVPCCPTLPNPLRPLRPGDGFSKSRAGREVPGDPARLRPRQRDNLRPGKSPEPRGPCSPLEAFCSEHFPQAGSHRSEADGRGQPCG